MTARRMVPPVVSGYPLTAFRLSVYQPAAASQIVENPSIERATTNYTAVGGSIARSFTRQRFGSASLEVTPTSGANDGAYYGGTTPLALVSGTLYYGSVFGYLAPGVPYKIYFATTGGVQVGTSVTIIGRGRWERMICPYRETATANRRLYVTKANHASTVVFYLDGFNVSDTLCTYIDGDQKGFLSEQAAYYWIGTPHASASVRVLATRAGGVEVRLSDYGFHVLSLVGMGLGGFENLSTPNANSGGSRYESTIYTERTFDVVGVFLPTDGFPDLQNQRRKLEAILKPNAAILTQPLTLVYQTVNDDGYVMGEPVEIVCSLEPGGLSGNWNNEYQESVTLTFRVYTPHLGKMRGSHGASLAYQESQSSGFIFSRDSNGDWSRVGDGLNGAVDVILPLPNGKLLVGGNYTNASGVADADYLALYDYSTNLFTALNATPLSARVRALALLPDGVTVLVGGEFLNAGTANGDYLCYLNLTTGAYSAINATPLSAAVDAIAVLPNGDALIGGQFINAVTANGDYLIKLVGTTYTVVNLTPLSARVRAIAVLPSGNAIIGGDFVNAGNASGDYICLLTISTGAYSALNASPLTATTGVYSLAVGPDGKLYVGTDAQVYSWGGTNQPFNILGSVGVNNDVLKILPLRNRTLLLGGTFTTAGGLTLAGFIAGWNGTAFTPFDFVTTGGTSVSALAETPDGKLIIGTAAAITGPAAAVTTTTYDGSADSFPVFEFTGPGTLYQLRNFTNGSILYFDLVLNAGERAMLTLGAGRLSFVSTFRGNIYNTILPGSFTASFRLSPGANSLSVLIAGTTDANTALSAFWDVNYSSVDDALYR